MEEILDPKKPWNIACAAWGIHLKKEPATNRLQPGGLRSSTERATRELAETSPYGFRRFDRDCFCAFMSSSTNKKESVVCSLHIYLSPGLRERSRIAREMSARPISLSAPRSVAEASTTLRHFPCLSLHQEPSLSASRPESEPTKAPHP